MQIAGVNEPILNVFDVDETDLSLNIEVELDYFGYASVKNINVSNYGVTYVLDFEDYDAHKDAIDVPGTCQNRDESAFIGKSFVNDYWQYSLSPQVDIGSDQYLAYPPPDPVEGQWSVSMKEGSECDTVVYSGKFTWNDLRKCGPNGGNGGSYTNITISDDWYNLTGIFYINLVSPYLYDQDTGFYRVFQLLSQPFVIAMCRVINVYGSTGVNLMILSVIAVYKDDKETDFKLILETETAEYLRLTRTDSDTFNFIKADGNTNILSNNNFKTKDIPESSGCYTKRGYICSQLWEIDAKNIGCKQDSGADFTGEYQLSFTPICRNTTEISNELNAYCNQWLDDHPDIQNKVSLNTNLVWKDTICDPAIFVTKFDAEMTFYANDSYSSPVDDQTYLYQVGEATVYTEIITSFPDNSFEIFDATLLQVHICTFDPLLAPSTDSSDLATFGCFGDRDSEFDEYFYKIYDSDASIAKYQFEVIQESQANTFRFSFRIPDEVARDRLYIQAEIEIALIELQQQPVIRRRLLVSGNSNSNKDRNKAKKIKDKDISNQIGHYIDSIGISDGVVSYTFPQKPISYPDITYHVSSISTTNYTAWITVICGVLSLIFSVNIMYMCYQCCYKPQIPRETRYEYRSVKVADSEEFDESEMNAIHVGSE